MKFTILFFSFLSLVVFGTSAQTQDSYDYQSEFTWGINKNTYGGLIGGLAFKKARKLNDRLLESFGLEVMNVKHPLEKRTSSQSGNYFIYGKSNYLYALRLQYGRDLIIFRKAPQQGVEIKAVTAIGPTIGIVSPYYIERAGEPFPGAGMREPFDPKRHNDPSKINGPGRLFEGLGESKIQPGANLKAALNFELGTTKNQVTGFEAGFLLDAYAKKVVMVPTARNYAVYPIFFFTLFYGGRK